MKAMLNEKNSKYIEERLSVIVTVYNVEEFLNECIDSLINQTMLPHEIILVDDGSTDRCAEICEEYHQKYDSISVIHQSNKGVSAARLAGYEHASTEYVLYVDADDFLDKNLIERVSPFLNKGIDVITYGIIRFHDENYIIEDKVALKPGVYNREKLEDEVFPCMLWDCVKHTCGVDAAFWNKVFKKELLGEYIQNIRDLNIHYGEDVGVIYLALLQARSLAVIEECMYYHRRRKEGRLPSYILNDDYIDKLHALYTYLRMQLQHSPEMIKQLEYFYLHALEVRLHKYGDYRTRRQYVFPFDRVAKEKVIVLYGAGEVGQDYYKQLEALDYCKEIIWVDQNYRKFLSLGVRSPEILSDKKNIDYVVVAILSQNAYMNISETLQKKGFTPENIIWNIRH